MNNARAVSLGIYPLNAAKYPKVPGYPTPSAKFLQLHCEELHKSKQKQVVNAETMFDRDELWAS